MEGGQLSPSLEAALRSLLAIAHVEHVLVSNGFGLPIARVSARAWSIDPAPLETHFPIVFAKASEAVDRLPLGKARSATTIASHFVLVQASLAPLVVAAVARPAVDVAHLAAAVPALAALLEPMRAAAEAEGVY